MEKSIKYLPVFLFGVVGLATLVPFIFTGFSNNDDISYYLGARNGHFWNIGNIYAKGQGRFYFLITIPISECFYLFDNYLISKFINIVLVLLDFIAIGYIAKELFKNKWYGYLCYLLMLVFISIKGIYNPIVSYPVYFSGSFLIVLYAIYFAIRYKNTGINKYKVISAIFYCVGILFYESYLMYLPLIILIINSGNPFYKSTILIKLKNSISFLLIGIIYCIAYFSYRIAYPSIYPGSTISSNISLSNFFNTLANFVSGSFPMKMTFSEGLTVYGGVDYLKLNSIGNILYLVVSEHFIWIFRSFIISILLYFILQKITLPKPKQLLTISIIAILYIYLPNIPITLSEKNLSTGGLPYYTTTYFSVFSTTLCLTILFILLCSGIRNFKYKGICFLIISIIIGIVSIVNDFANYQALKALRIPLNVFNFADKFAESKEYSFLPENTFIYSPLFFDNSEDIVHITHGNDFKWNHYFYFKSHKKPVFFLNSKDKIIERITKNLRPNYYLNYGRYHNDMDQFFAFSSISEYSKIDSVNNYITSDSVVIYYYSKNKTFSVIFNANNIEKTFVVNNKTLPKLKGFVEFDVLNANYQNDFVTIIIKTKEIDLNSIRVTNITKPGSISIILN